MPIIAMGVEAWLLPAIIRISDADNTKVVASSNSDGVHQQDNFTVPGGSEFLDSS